MTSHELAQELLKLPNVPVMTTDGEYGYPEVVTGARTYTASDQEMSMLYLEGQRQRIEFTSRGGYSG